MFEAHAIVIRKDPYVGTFQERGVFRFPFPGATAVARRGYVPARQQVDFVLALADHDQTIVGDRLDEFGQLVRYDAAPLGVADPVPRVVWIGALLFDRFPAVNLGAHHDMNERAGLVVVGMFGDERRVVAAVAVTVGLAVGLFGQRGDVIWSCQGGHVVVEGAAVEVVNKIDNVAAGATTATVPD